MLNSTDSQAKNLRTDLAGLLAGLWSHLSRRRKRQFALMLGLMLLSALAEVISIGAVLPFLAVLTAPERMLSYPFIDAVARSLGVVTPADLTLLLTVAFASSALGAGAIRLLLLWSGTRLAYASGADISNEVYRRTLYQPYHVHVSRNSSEVISGLTDKADIAAFVLYQALLLTSSAVLIVAIVLVLLTINLIVAIVAAVGMGITYGLVGWSFRKRLAKNAQTISRESTQVIKSLQEGLGAIRDVLLDGNQRFYCDIYRQADLPLRQARGNNVFLSQGPRFAIEAFGIALFAALAYGLTGRSEGVATALPVLGALALGAQRLLPAVQQSFAAWANISGNANALIDALALLEQPLSDESLIPPPDPLSFSDAISFENVRFRYGPEDSWVLDGVNFRIPKGARVGLVGSTGAGKSTALDILMGLLEPSEGRVLVDGKPIDGNRLRAWQRTVAHVPQSIYLSDATLAENIAFGVSKHDIDMDRVRLAAGLAEIADFIESRPQGYGAFVGERGIRLSGGQRQRIGIARALYKQAGVLVLDEATSALDNATEQDVMASIEGLSRNLTIVIVAHRLTTVMRCDLLIELGDHRVLAQGSYDSLLRTSDSFRSMVNAIGEKWN